MTLHRQYKEACECVNQSGGGLEGDEHTSFFDHVRTICKWYDQMNPIFGSKPSSYAAYTNEMNSDDNNENDNDDDNDDTFFHDDRNEDDYDNDKASIDSNSVASITENIGKKLSVEDISSSSSNSSNDNSVSDSRVENESKPINRPAPPVLDIWSRDDDDIANDLSTPGTASSRSINKKNNSNNQIKTNKKKAIKRGFL